MSQQNDRFELSSMVVANARFNNWDKNYQLHIQHGKTVESTSSIIVGFVFNKVVPFALGSGILVAALNYVGIVHLF